MKSLADVQQHEISLEEANRQAAVEELARQFWEFEGRRTVVNRPNDPVEAVRVGGRDYHPDVIVFGGEGAEGDNQVETVCLVATSDEVNADAAAVWKVLADSGRCLHLFVPRRIVDAGR